VKIQFNQIFWFNLFIDDFKYDENYAANEETYDELRKATFTDICHQQQQNEQLDNPTATTDLNLSSSGSSVGEKENWSFLDK